MDKNNDLVMVKELFTCWDEKRLGHITIETLAENLISFGLSMSQDQVLKLLSALSFDKDSNSKSLDITLNNFIKIFERDTFGEKATTLIKKACVSKKEEIKAEIVAEILRKRSKNNSKVGDSELGSMKSGTIS
jgi:hypothetical protein